MAFSDTTDDLTELDEWLTLLKTARKDIAESGLVKRVEKGNFIVTFWNPEEITNEIRKTKNRIAILSTGAY